MKSKAQTATVFIVILAAMLVLTAELANIGKLSHQRTRLTNAVDSASLSLGSSLGSYAYSLSQEYCGGIDYSEFEVDYSRIVDAVKIVIAVVIAVIIAILTKQPTWAIAVAGLLIGGTMTANFLEKHMELIPEESTALNRRLSELPEPERFKEQAAQQVLRQLVDDPNTVVDTNDNDEDGDTTDKISAFTKWSAEHIKSAEEKWYLILQKVKGFRCFPYVRGVPPDYRDYSGTYGAFCHQIRTFGREKLEYTATDPDGWPAPIQILPDPLPADYSFDSYNSDYEIVRRMRSLNTDEYDNLRDILNVLNIEDTYNTAIDLSGETNFPVPSFDSIDPTATTSPADIAAVDALQRRFAADFGDYDPRTRNNLTDAADAFIRGGSTDNLLSQLKAYKARWSTWLDTLADWQGRLDNIETIFEDRERAVMLAGPGTRDSPTTYEYEYERIIALKHLAHHASTLVEDLKTLISDFLSQVETLIYELDAYLSDSTGNTTYHWDDSLGHHWVAVNVTHDPIPYVEADSGDFLIATVNYLQLHNYNGTATVSAARKDEPRAGVFGSAIPFWNFRYTKGNQPLDTSLDVTDPGRNPNKPYYASAKVSWGGNKHSTSLLGTYHMEWSLPCITETH